MTNLYYLKRLLISILTAIISHATFAETSASSATDNVDLQEINRPVLENKKLDVNAPRTPSFLLQDKDGTQIREYRERDRPTSIEVESGFGTSYHMTQPDNGATPTQGDSPERLPTIDILKF